MNPYITPDQLHEVASTNRERTRKRRPLPPLEARDWMTPHETALALGCSVATVHRHAPGLDPRQSNRCHAASMDGKLSFEKPLWPAGRNVTRKVGWRRDTVDTGSGIRGRDAGKARAHDHQESKEISTRQYLQIRKRRDLVREVLSRSRCSAETCSTRPNFGDGREGKLGPRWTTSWPY